MESHQSAFGRPPHLRLHQCRTSVDQTLREPQSLWPSLATFRRLLGLLAQCRAATRTQDGTWGHRTPRHRCLRPWWGSPGWSPSARGCVCSGSEKFLELGCRPRAISAWGGPGCRARPFCWITEWPSHPWESSGFEMSFTACSWGSKRVDGEDHSPWSAQRCYGYRFERWRWS